MRTSDIKSRFEKRARTMKSLERSAVGFLIVVLLLVEPFVGPVHANDNPPGHVNPDPGHIKGAGRVPARGGGSGDPGLSKKPIAGGCPERAMGGRQCCFGRDRTSDVHRSRWPRTEAISVRVWS
jgi:hypothetical protein